MLYFRIRTLFFIYLNKLVIPLTFSKTFSSITVILHLRRVKFSSIHYVKFYHLNLLCVSYMYIVPEII